MSNSVPGANRQWSRSVRALHLLGSVLLSGGILAGLGSFAYAQSAAASPAPRAMQVVGGRLAWGFTRTLQGEPRSAWPSIIVGQGATREADGTIDFPAAGGSYDSASGTATMKYRGTATLTYRAGKVTVTNPTVTIDRTGTALRADLSTTPSQARLTQADVGAMQMSGVAPQVAARTVTWPQVPTTLTATGATAFPDGFEGASLGPMTFAATLAAPSQPQVNPQVNPPAARPNARSASTPFNNLPVPNASAGATGTSGATGGATPNTSDCPTPSPGASLSSAVSTTPSPAATGCPASTTPSSAPTSGSGPPAKLAKTGGPLVPLAIFGIALTVAGGGTMVGARRRARAERRRWA